MKFVSVNGQAPPAGFEQVVLQSIAPDGGLYVPETISRLPSKFLDHLSGQSLQSTGFEVAALLLEDVPGIDLAGIAERAWNFSVPLIQLEDNLFLLELFHCPTLAFKDIGARFMAEVMSHFLAAGKRRVTILVATSGDTGSAVAHGFFNSPHIDVCILYPSGKVSRLQEQQMTTLGGNIRALEVAGTFDDCQHLVKQALVDPEITSARVLTSANSINLARLLPQTVYYIWGMAQWLKNFKSDHGLPTILVPSGNFGNLTAAVYAKQMGAPIEKFIAATNLNDVVPRYLLSGIYEPHDSQQTLSNAMDVGSPNNFIRLQYLYKNDLAAMRSEIEAHSINDAETLEEIRQTYRRTNVIIDPHTAVGVAAARKFAHGHPVIVAATAHPAKFPEVIRKALGQDIPLPPSLESALKKPKRSTKISNNYMELKQILLA